MTPRGKMPYLLEIMFRFYRLIIALFLLNLVATQTFAGSPLAHVETPIPTQAPAEDQGQVGFCWAYSMTGLLESNLRRGGEKAPNLSEEYLGFYHLYSQLKNPNPFLEWSLRRNSFNGLFFGNFLSSIGMMLGAPKEGSLFEFALEDLEKFGIVPESVFRTKFSDEKNRLQPKIDEFLRTDYAKNFDFYKNNPGPLKLKVESFFGAAVPNPESEFTFEDRKYTPVSFAKEYLGFKKADYEVIRVTPENHSTALADLRTRFAAGESVPIAFSVLNDTPSKKGGIFSAKNCDPSPCKFDGRHAVLAVASVRSEAPFSMIESDVGGIVIRNSWGAKGLKKLSLADFQFDFLADLDFSTDGEEKTPLYFIENAYFEEGFKHFSYWEYLSHKH